MATYQTRSDALLNYIPTIDVAAYTKVLDGLQKGYDHNVGELNKTEEHLKSIAQNTNLSEEAKDYFYGRMRERKDVLEKNMGNFAFANELDYGMKVLNSAVDDVVAVEQYNGSIPKNIFTQHTKLAEGKHPELANSVNLEYSLQDINKWQNTKGHLGKKFQGNTNYVPYTDIQKVLQELNSKLPANVYAELNKFGTFTYTSGGVEKKIDADIQRAVDTVFASNPGVAKQIEINAWNQFRGVDDKSMVESFARYASTKADQYAKLSANHKAFEEGEKLGKKFTRKKDATMSDEEATNMEQASNYYSNQSEGYGKMLEALKNGNLSRKQIEQEIYKGELKYNFGNTFAYSKSKNKTLVTDQGAMNIWNEQNKQSQFNATMRYNAEKDANDLYLKTMTAYNEGKLNADQVASLGLPANQVSSIVSSDVKLLPAEAGDAPDIDTEIKKVGETQAQNNKALRGLYSDLQLNYGVGVDIASLSNEDRESFFNSLEQSLKDGKNKDFEWKDRQGKSYIIKENQQMLDQITKIREFRNENRDLGRYVRSISEDKNKATASVAINYDTNKYELVDITDPLFNITSKMLKDKATGAYSPVPHSGSLFGVNSKENTKSTKEYIYNKRREFNITFGSEQTNYELKSQATKAEAIRMGFAKELNGIPEGVEEMKPSQIIKLMDDGKIPEFQLIYDSKAKKLVIYGDRNMSLSDKVGEVDEGMLLKSNILSEAVRNGVNINNQKFASEKLGTNIRSQTYNGNLVAKNPDTKKMEITDPEKYISIRTVFNQGKYDHVATKQDVEGNIYVSYVYDGKWYPNSVKISSEELYTSEGNEKLANTVNEMEMKLKAEASK